MIKGSDFKMVTMALHDNIRQITYLKMDEFRGPGKQNAELGLWHFPLGTGWGNSDFSQFEFPSRHLIALQQLMHRSNVQRITHEMQPRQSKPRRLFFFTHQVINAGFSCENCVCKFRSQNFTFNFAVFFRKLPSYTMADLRGALPAPPLQTKISLIWRGFLEKNIQYIN